MAKPILYHGIKYPSLKALFYKMAADGISYPALISRLNLGWDLERALTEQISKNNQRTYTVDGCHYPHLKALSEAAGISYVAAVKRMHRGWTDSEIMHGRRTKKSKEITIKEKKPRGTPIYVKGVKYENLRDAYDSLKPSISYNTVRARLRYGWSVEEALDSIEKIDRRKTSSKVKELVLNGKKFNAKEISVEFNIPYTTVLDRIHRGATAEQVAGLVSIGPHDLISQAEAYRNRKKVVKKYYVVDGITYTSIPMLAKAFSLSPQLVYNRIRENGWSAKRAVSEPISESVIVNGKEYRSAMSAWEAIGQTSFSVYTARKTNGHKLEVCLGLEALPPLERYELHGKKYASLAEIGLAYGLSVGQLQSRIQGMSLEEAVSYTPSNGRYSETIFKENPTLGKSLGRLYFIRIILSSGTLHKIGITQKEISKRFNGFDYQIIAEYQGPLFYLYQIEQKILIEFRDYHYRGDEDFEGKTETFLLLDDEEMEMHRFIISEASKHGCSNLHI